MAINKLLNKEPVFHVTKQFCRAFSNKEIVPTKDIIEGLADTFNNILNNCRHFIESTKNMTYKIDICGKTYFDFDTEEQVFEIVTTIPNVFNDKEVMVDTTTFLCKKFFNIHSNQYEIREKRSQRIEKYLDKVLIHSDFQPFSYVIDTKIVDKNYLPTNHAKEILNNKVKETKGSYEKLLLNSQRILNHELDNLSKKYVDILYNGINDHFKYLNDANKICSKISNNLERKKFIEETRQTSMHKVLNVAVKIDELSKNTDSFTLQMFNKLSGEEVDKCKKMIRLHNKKFLNTMFRYLE